jgi:hypothetical protein
MLAKLDWRLLGALALISFAGSVVPSEATLITFEVAPVAGNTFEYRYVVENDTLGVEIEEFAVYFDVDLFRNLRMPTAPTTDWDAEIFQPDPMLPDDGILDVLALMGGIAPGTGLGVFTVWADFLGAGTPGRQPFEVRDPGTFDVLDSGFTVPAGGPVPEPATLWLAGLGIGALGLRRKATTAPSRTDGTSR